MWVYYERKEENAKLRTVGIVTSEYGNKERQTYGALHMLNVRMILTGSNIVLQWTSEW